MAGPLTISLNVVARSGLVLRNFEKSYLRYTGHEHRLRLQVNDEVDSLDVHGNMHYENPWILGSLLARSLRFI